MHPDDEARPADGRTGQEPGGRQTSSSAAAYRRMDERAGRELRMAWLTVYADLLYVVDPRGVLSAQLLDLRDLLGAQDDDSGWAS